MFCVIWCVRQRGIQGSGLNLSCFEAVDILWGLITVSVLSQTRQGKQYCVLSQDFKIIEGK